MTLYNYYLMTLTADRDEALRQIHSDRDADRLFISFNFKRMRVDFAYDFSRVCSNNSWVTGKVQHDCYDQRVLGHIRCLRCIHTPVALGRSIGGKFNSATTLYMNLGLV